LSVSLLKDNTVSITPQEAFEQGTNIKKALAVAPDMVRGWIVSEVGRLIKDMDMKTTISSNEELMFCCRSIIEERPALTLEEIRVVFDMVRKGKFGKLYERLKTAEILGFFEKYAGTTRAAMLEERNRNRQYQHEVEAREALQRIDAGKLADSVRDHTPTPQGLGTRLRKQWDAKTEQSEGEKET
jgi:hypothetical protein